MNFDVIAKNTDLFIVGVAAAATLMLGFIVFFNNKNSITNRIFLFFSLITATWGVVNFFAHSITSVSISFLFLRLVIFFAVGQSFCLYQLFSVFPETNYTFSKFNNLFVFPFVVFTAILTLTPLVFNKVIRVSEDGKILEILNGPGIVLFGIVSIGLVLSAFFMLVKKIIKSSKEQKKPLIIILLGTLITFSLIIIFNFIFPAIKGDSRFVIYGAVWLLPFIICNSYAIIHHGILNIKIISTEFIVFGLSVAMLFDVITAEDMVSLIYKSSLFLLVVSVGILLIKSVQKEVDQRERLTKLARSLENANIRLQELDRQKTEFLSIASHQLRTPLSILKGYIELIKDGAYGKVGIKVKNILDNMDESNERLVKLVDEFLDISRIEQGRTKFVFEQKDMNKLIDSVVKELDQRAKDKGLEIVWKPGKVAVDVCMDEDKVRHVVFNFIDNAIKYSMEGKIKVLVEREKDGFAVRVKDNGIGFEKTDQVNFFQKFYRGANVKHTNVGGTGLGIYVCRQFIEKHGGVVWAKSEGLGKGGEFGFHIPFNFDKKDTTIGGEK